MIALLRFLRRSSLLFFILLLALPSGVNAQEPTSMPLAEVLRLLEDRYEIKFTYLDENVNEVRAALPAAVLSLEEAIQNLRSQIPLNIQQINERFVAITKKTTDRIDVCGYVLDASSLPLVGANVRIGQRYATTDTNGFFAVTDLSLGEEVTISHLGYKTMRLKTQQSMRLPCRQWFLREQVVSLQEIVLKDYLTKGIDKTASGSLAINTSELDILPGLIEPDVLQAIQVLPGIQSINETVSNINVRGGTHDQNLILWDGIKMYNSGHFFGLISAFNPYLSDKVSLIKNGSSAHLTDGVSSTIAIESENQVQPNLELGAGINLINADAYAKIPIANKASMAISARRSLADIFETPTYKQYFDRAFRDTDVINTSDANNTTVNTDESFYFYDVGVKLLYDVSDKDKLRVNFLSGYNSIAYLENATFSDRVESRTSSLKQQNLAGGLHYERQWTDQWKTSFQYYASLYDLDAINFDIVNDQRLIQENKVLDTGVKFGAQFEISEALSVGGGYQFYETGITNLQDVNNPVFRRNIKEVLRVHAGYAELNYKNSKRTTFATIGGRLTRLQKFGRWLLEPRVSFQQKLNEVLTFELLGEFKHQTTSQIIDFQNDFLGVEQRRWVLSNAQDIPVIESKQASIGLNYQDRGLLIDFTSYYKTVDGITTSSQGFQNQFQLIRRSGSYDAYGADLLIRQRFGNWNVWGSYAFLQSEYTFDSLEPTTFTNNFEVTHAVNVSSSFSLRKFQWAASVNWRSGRPFTLIDVSTPVFEGGLNFEAPNTTRLDPFLRLDLSSTYKFQLGNRLRGMAGLSLWNLLSNQNVVNAYYRLNEQQEAVLVEQEALGITPNLSFRVQF